LQRLSFLPALARALFFRLHLALALALALAEPPRADEGAAPDWSW
jgi:hypothetical protein